MKIQTYILVLIVGMFATKFAIANKILLIQDIDKDCGTGEPYTPGEVDKDNSPKLRDCEAIYANSNWDRSAEDADFYYEGDIYPDGPEGPKVSVTCMNNWISVQERSNLALKFDKSFDDYKNGFSDDYDFWIGLEKLHQLTKDGSYRAMFRINTETNGCMLAHYSEFKVGPGPEYLLQASGYLEGHSAGDCLTPLSGQYFSTPDRDVYGISPSGGWWYPEFSEPECNPHGKASADASSGGMFWFDDGKTSHGTYIGIQKNDLPPLKTCEDANYWYYSPQHTFDLYPEGLEGQKIEALCDGPYTLIQAHYSNAVQFTQKSMEAYKTGFGDVSVGDGGWLGLDNIRALTTEGSYQLQVRLRMNLDRDEWAYILYSDFSVGPGPDYKLTISGYSSIDGFFDAGDCLSILNGEKFSTFDNDPTGMSSEHDGAGWWFPSGEGAEMNCNFNGDYNSQKPSGLFYFNHKIYESYILMAKKKLPTA